MIEKFTKQTMREEKPENQVAYFLVKPYINLNLHQYIVELWIKIGLHKEVKQTIQWP